MKKFLLMLIAVFTLCACSSDSYDDVKNEIIYDGNTHQINNVEMDKNRIWFYTSDGYWFTLNSEKITVGKKIYLIADEQLDSSFSKFHEPDSYADIVHSWCNNEDYNNKRITSDSYVLVKGSNDDNRYYIEVFLDDGVKYIRATYYGTPKLGYMGD